MSDDEVVSMTMLGEPAEPEAPEGTATHWTRIVTAVSAAVGAVALAVIASAQLQQAQDLDQQRCLQEAQLLAFGPVGRGVDQAERFREGLAECGIDVPTEEG